LPHYRCLQCYQVFAGSAKDEHERTGHGGFIPLELGDDPTVPANKCKPPAKSTATFAKIGADGAPAAPTWLGSAEAPLPARSLKAIVRGMPKDAESARVGKSLLEGDFVSLYEAQTDQARLAMFGSDFLDLPRLFRYTPWRTVKPPSGDLVRRMIIADAVESGDKVCWVSTAALSGIR